MRGEGSAVGHGPEKDHPDYAESTTNIRRVIDSDNLPQELTYAPLIAGLSRPSPSSSHDPPSLSQVEVDRDLSELEPEPDPSICILPEYIDNLRGNVGSQDQQYLWLKGALTLPDDHLRSALVDCFVEYVHPTMPVVDLREFLGALHDCGNSSRPRISCLLFQAVMFSAVSYADLTILLNAGFASRRAARKLFHERAKLLYDLDVEQRPLVQVQALALLSHCTRLPGQIKEGWHWLGIAISVAFSLGLHQTRSGSPGDQPVSRQARRIWWTLYVRDRQQAQYLSRPMRIRDDEFDTPPLTLEDFDLENLEELHLPHLPFTSRKTLRRSVQANQAMIFIKMTELCFHVSGVLTTHFSMLSWKKSVAASEQLYSTSPTAWMMRRMRPEADIEGQHSRLTRWFAGLPPNCRYRAPSPAEIARTGGGSLLAHLALLHMAFHNTISTLHRFRAIPPHQASTFTLREQGIDSWHHVCQASQAISNISRDLHLDKLDQYLPTTLSTMQFAPILTQIARLPYESWENQEVALQNIFHCVKLVETQRSMYPSADWCAELVANMLSKGRISLLTDAEQVIYGLNFGDIGYNSRESATNFTMPLAPSEVHIEQNMDGTIPPVSHDERANESEQASTMQIHSNWDPSMVQDDLPEYDTLMNGTGQHEPWHGSGTLSDDWMEMLFSFEDSRNTFLHIV